ncbi:toluene tolerance protein [Iodidimonas nitroreducens]|uniref:Toluene tolerance protein n=1 Tax=Iodidimonas nitroreducens TaxID=1236968 RepID=A0A5A7N4H1_9PROT|nr:ABC transporter substrate-binding protein [Iodidimonas nitroreducens]GAK33780.1 putative phospholipid-binding protein MlaC [alpha proteobacterium Q-1]GER02897.1 toluene tolerance protein [Iodidimonas nitroreducens]
MKQNHSSSLIHWQVLVASLVLIIGLFSLQASAQETAAADPEGAKDFIAQLSDDAVKVWADPTKTEAERQAAFRQLLHEGFDVDFISKLVLGRYMRTASDAQLQEYQKLFPDFIVNSFAGRIGDYGNEKLVVDGTTEAGPRDIFVRSKIVRPGGEPLSADWRLRKKDDKFQIVDIKVEGISMAITQRDEFSSLIQREGFDRLLETLRKGANAASASEAG